MSVLDVLGRATRAPEPPGGTSAEVDWRHRAVCREEDPELFFPVGTTGPALLQIEEAKAVCRRCPVIDACLAWALRSGQEAGVWGGLSEDERAALLRGSTRRHAHKTAPEPDPAPVHPPRLLDKADRERAVRHHWSLGKNDPQIAAVTGLHVSTVYCIRRRLGLAALPRGLAR